MRLTIFGASGQTGRRLVEQALDGGHAVTAVVRDPTRLPSTTSKARALGQDTLERSRRVLGPDHLVTLGTASVLALVLPRSGEAEQARALGRDTLERYRRILGPDHPHTLLLAKVVASPTTEKGQHQTDLLWLLRPHMTAAPNDQMQR